MFRRFRMIVGLSGLILLTTIALGAQKEKSADGAGITKGQVDVVNNVPVLNLDGKRVPPLIFFFNNEAVVGVKRGYWEPQVKLVGEAGVHIYSFALWLPALGTDAKPSTEALRSQLEPFIKADPKALFLPRINVTAPAAWLKANPDAQMVFADGSRENYEAIASEKWKKEMGETLGKYIAFVEASSYGPRFVAYHIAGQNSGEWFPESFREKGPDLSPANNIGFRAWLKAKYKNDDALRKAWGNKEVTLETAVVPKPEPGRFPIHNDPKGEMFYRLPEERNWVDYSQYTSELTASTIVDFAKIVKKETQGRKLTVFFYGYTMDICGSMNGHNDLMRLLKCPEVDLIASPDSYGERLRGESIGIMSAVDSVESHGKIWIIEDDMRTHLWAPQHQPPEIAKDPGFLSEYNWMPRPRDSAETVNILKRDFSAMLAHRCGTWWMDLSAVGSYNDPAIWKMVGENRPRYEKFYENPSPYRPEVAIILDEVSRNYEKSDWDLSAQTIINTRYQMGLTGASYGQYLLEDFVNGVVPQCKAYVFVNAFSLDEPRVDAIRARLEKEGSTAVWAYAPGYIAPSGVSIEQSQRLTGMKLAVKEGKMGSHWVGSEGSGETWGIRYRMEDQPRVFEVSPRLVVEDDQAKIIGRYITDGQASSAVKKEGNATHVFLGDMNLSASLLRRVLRDAGVHLWTDVNLVVHTDGSFLSVHVKEAGVYPIYLPDQVKIESSEGRIVGSSDKVVYALFDRGETRLFKILPAAHE